MVKHFLLILIIPVMALSCVSMRKFLSVEQACADLKRDSIEFSKRISVQNNRIDDLTRRNISLGQDSLRLYSSFTSLRDKHELEMEEYRQEILRLTGQLYGTSKRSYNRGNLTEVRFLKAAASLSKSLTSYANEIRSVLSVYDKSLYDVTDNNWEITIILRDSLLYPALNDNGMVAYDRRKMTHEGLSVLSKLSSLMVRKANYNVIVKEHTFINSPNLGVMLSAKDENLSISKTDIAAIIDTILNANEIKLSRSTRNLSNSAVIDMTESKRIDSLRAVREAERIRQKEIERLSSIAQEQERALRNATDRSSVVMRNLMRSLYNKIGNNVVSREILYIKSEQENSAAEHLEIVLRPNISELYDLIKELERSKR